MFSIALLAVLLVAIYNIQVDELVGDREALAAERRRRSIVAWVLALVAMAERLIVTFAPSAGLSLVSSICWLPFFCFITWHELRAVLRQRQVTGETISMSISVYLLLGLTWGTLYIVIYQLQPNAFSFPGPPATQTGPLYLQQSISPVLIYFSLTTLTSIGYGDITPLTLQARYAAIAEGVTGQFYIAILVARLVAMQMSRPTTHRTGNDS